MINLLKICLGIYGCCFVFTPHFNSLSALNILADQPKHVINATGDGVSVWEAFDSVTNSWKVQTASFTVGGGWTTPVDVASDSTHAYYTPLISINSSGDAVAAWIGSDFTTGYSIIQAAMYLSGSWTSVVTVSDNGGEYVNPDFQIALSDSGVAVLNWSSYVGPFFIGPEIRAAYALTSGGNSWTSPGTISN